SWPAGSVPSDARLLTSTPAETLPLDPPVPSDRPARARLAHDPRDSTAHRARQHRPPRHERELARALDQAKSSRGKVQPSRHDALDPRAHRGLHEHLAFFRGEPRRNAQQLTPPQARERAVSHRELSLLLDRQSLAE